MEYTKTWKGTLTNGEYEFRYAGDSTPVIKELIKNLQDHLYYLEKGVIAE